MPSAMCGAQRLARELIGENILHVFGLGSDGVQSRRLVSDATRCYSSSGARPLRSWGWNRAPDISGSPGRYSGSDISCIRFPTQFVKPYVILLIGMASCRGNNRPVGSKSYSASASGEVAMFASSCRGG
jgi:hypothetical protein